jgi:hypothetical protein
MATIPQTRLRIDDDGNYLPVGKDYPGHTVDALLADGKIEEARAELERLILEGVDSGPGIEVTPEFWEDIRSEMERKQQADRA